MTRMRLLMCAGAFALACVGPASAANLVINGDFEAGNTGFSSDYTFVVDYTPPGIYGVDDDPNDGHPAFSSFGDHTTGEGLMMVLNGSEEAGKKVWFQDGISVAANTDYYFSTWIASAHPTSPAKLNFSINGSSIGPTFVAPATTGNWVQFFASWNSGAATTADIALVNMNLDFGGNDFTLDDIVLSTRMPGVVPEPGTWAMLIMGFGAAGAMLRRRHTAVTRI